MRNKLKRLLNKHPKEVFATVLFALLTTVIAAQFATFLPFFVFIFTLGYLVGLVTP